jgi:hypothetical protein
MHEENIYDLLEQFDKETNNPIFETDFRSNRDLFIFMQHYISAIAEGFDWKFEKVLSEPEKITQLVKQSSKKHA